MRIKLIEHLLSTLFVTVIMSLIIFYISSSDAKIKNNAISTQNEIVPKFVNLDDNFDRLLLLDVMNIFYPDQYDINKSKIDSIAIKRSDEFAEALRTSGVKKSLTPPVIFKILKMYLKFLFVYVLVMLLTYYSVITAGVWRFIRRKGKREKINNHQKPLYYELPLLFLRKFIKLLIHMILFSPAFVIAYAIKTDLDTDSMPFMIFLGTISNGLLIIYTNKFYAFLVAESRKGYVDTAIVKNMNNSYLFNSEKGIYLKTIFKPIKKFEGHVFGHIYKNAVKQYLSTIKEQAAFLITGLIIIEMALNIHGYLNYEMLKEVLYGNWTVVVFIILLLFYTSKATEVISDLLAHYSQKQYEN